MPKNARFSDADQKRFAHLKSELHRRLPSLPDSETIFDCALMFIEVRDGELHQLDGEDDCDTWMDRLYKVGPHQANKYFSIGQRLTRDEVRVKTQGVEVMYQISLAPPELRDCMWQLGETERLSSGALAAGRLAALPLLQKNRPERALRKLVSVAHAQARKEAQEKANRKAARKGPVELLRDGLDRSATRLESLLRQGKLTPEEARAIRGELARLLELDRKLAEVAGDAPSGTSETSQQAQSQASEGVAAALAQCLTPREQEQVQQHLVRLIITEVPPKGRSRLIDELGRRWTALGGPPKELAESLARLHDPDREVRGLAALHLLVASRLPDYEMKLRSLLFYKLPDRLMRAVLDLCDVESSGSSLRMFRSAPERFHSTAE